MAGSNSTHSTAIQQLLQETPHLWRGREHGAIATLDTGFDALNGLLPGGGWPLGSLIEIAPSCDGIGELSLPLPALRAMAREGKHIALVRPPYMPYAPAFRRAQLPLKRLLWLAIPREAEALWAAEQLLRGGSSTVLLWCERADDRPLRRLQLAAEASRSIAFVYRPSKTLTQPSPAALRIALLPDGHSLCLKILKVRGGHPGELSLALPAIAGLT